MYAPTDSSATHASTLATLLRQLEEVELCELLVPNEPNSRVWLGVSKSLYSSQLAELRTELGALRLMLGNVVSQFEVLAVTP